MHLNPLDFNFLVILNLLIMLVWPVNGYYTSTRPAQQAPAGTRINVFGIIMLILTVIAVIFDIVFVVIKLVGA